MLDDNRIAKYTAAIDGVLRWIAEHLQPDGSYTIKTSSGAYFPAVTFANHIGRRDLAHSTLRLVSEQFIAPDGTLRQLESRSSNIVYVPSWYVWGAAEAGWLNLSNTLVAFTQSMQHAETGGVFGSIADRDVGRGAISFDGTTLAGIGYGRAGRVDACRGVGDFLLRLLQVQPDVNDRFYTDWQEPGGLVQDDQAIGPVLRWDQPKQHYYKMGLFVIALLEAYGVSGEGKYIEAAMAGYHLATDRAVDLFNNTLSHKMCWAAARLYAATGERGYVEDACKYADHLITLQQADGGFHYPELWATYPPEVAEFLPNMMCQIGLWVALARDAMISVNK